jgi:hypothetical protein
MVVQLHETHLADDAEVEDVDWSSAGFTTTKPAPAGGPESTRCPPPPPPFLPRLPIGLAFEMEWLRATSNKRILIYKVIYASLRSNTRGIVYKRQHVEVDSNQELAYPLRAAIHSPSAWAIASACVFCRL